MKGTLKHLLSTRLQFEPINWFLPKANNDYHYYKESVKNKGQEKDYFLLSQSIHLDCVAFEEITVIKKVSTLEEKHTENEMVKRHNFGSRGDNVIRWNLREKLPTSHVK